MINIVYHVENQQLTRYSGDYYQFRSLCQEEIPAGGDLRTSARNRLPTLKDFVARNKARVPTRNMAMSRQKKLDKMDIIELQSEKPKPSFDFKPARTTRSLYFPSQGLQIGYDRPLTKPLNLTFERNQGCYYRGKWYWENNSLRSLLLGIIPPIAGEVERGDYLELVTLNKK